MGPERYALLAGCDFTLLPSRWEPCGLVQMEAMRMGTLPIVAPTGGLKDTVEDGLNGIWTDAEMSVEAAIDEDSVASISKALRRAAALFQEEPQKVTEMTKAAMAASAEFTWSNAALQYEAVFEELGVKNVLQGGYGTVTLEADKQAGRLLLESAKIAAGNVKPAAGPFPHTPRVLWLGVARCAKHLTGAGPVHGDGCGP
ncbi:unnamed protein product [Effrenium voratum]|nr:unnamed protein product [Effrenium voratum]